MLKCQGISAIASQTPFAPSAVRLSIFRCYSGAHWGSAVGNPDAIFITPCKKILRPLTGSQLYATMGGAVGGTLGIAGGWRLPHSPIFRTVVYTNCCIRLAVRVAIFVQLFFRANLYLQHVVYILKSGYIQRQGACPVACCNVVKTLQTAIYRDFSGGLTTSYNCDIIYIVVRWANK